MLNHPFAVFAAAAFIALTIAGITPSTRLKAAAEAPTVSPFQMMMDAKDLPVESADAI